MVVHLQLLTERFRHTLDRKTFSVLILITDLKNNYIPHLRKITRFSGCMLAKVGLERRREPSRLALLIVKKAPPLFILSQYQYAPASNLHNGYAMAL